MIQAIIYDLDHTLFDPGSIDKQIFESAFEWLESAGKFSRAEMAVIRKDFFSISLNAFIDKHLTDTTREAFVTKLKNLPPLPKLATYRDGHVVTEISVTNYLVTSGLTEFQNQKIDALGIRDWFAEIFIDDPVMLTWQDKEEIMECIIETYGYQPSELLVVGDNPHSEIKAGNNLGIQTIQILREGIIKSDLADQCIQTLAALPKIIDQ